MRRDLAVRSGASCTKEAGAGTAARHDPIRMTDVSIDSFLGEIAAEAACRRAVRRLELVVVAVTVWTAAGVLTVMAATGVSL